MFVCINVQTTGFGYQAQPLEIGVSCIYVRRTGQQPVLAVSEPKAWHVDYDTTLPYEDGARAMHDKNGLNAELAILRQHGFLSLRSRAWVDDQVHDYIVQALGLTPTALHKQVLLCARGAAFHRNAVQAFFPKTYSLLAPPDWDTNSLKYAMAALKCTRVMDGDRASRARQQVEIQIKELLVFLSMLDYLPL